MNIAYSMINSVRVRNTIVMPRSGNVALEIAKRNNDGSETRK